ncbi:MAG: ABC transporter ATP-binding protein [Spirochaeta sp.]|jgi:ABC-type Fe3+/spermidine/putrescine transport system ATPase subunit|nr:ABC transporter ATP-binding protein [Spirochaeta sp.]
MIQFHDVRKSYPEFDMRIDFSIGEGELVSILGPSGSGKTTTLRLIAGFERPDRGRIMIDNRDVTAMTPAERQIGYVFQDYTLFPHMDVAANVGYGLRVRHRPADEIGRKVSDLLELVDLPGYERRNIETLSGGERQRVAIARALAVDPVLLLLDEPFSSIDEVLRRDLRDEIVRLQKRLGITVVFVTHSQQEALAISDRVAVLRDGDVIQYDEVETLYRAPHSRFVASFVGEANFFPAPAGAAAGGQGEAQTLMLRPEQLELIGPEDQAGTGADRVVFDAEIETHQFLGAAHRYACRHAGGVAIVKDQRRFPVGAAVRIAYRVSAGYLLPGGTS